MCKVFRLTIFSIFTFLLTTSCQKEKDSSSQKLVLKEYYENGSIKSIRETIDSIPNGNTTFYYPEGKVKFSLTYMNGALNGPASFYHASGKIKSKNNYLNGKLHGDFISFYENGITDSKGKYFNSKPVGKHYEYFKESGSVKTINEFILYDTVIQLNTFIKYDLKGDIIESSPTIDFLEENGSLKIIIKEKMFSKLRVVVGDFDRFFILGSMESLDTTMSRDGLTLMIPYSKRDTVRGFVDNYKTIGNDSGASRPIWFSYPNPW